MIITVPDLTGAECGDIAITAAEGGIGYWSVIDSYDYERWAPDLKNIEVADDFVFYTIGSIVDGEEPFEAIDITPALIKRGLERALAAPLDEGGWMANGLLQVSREDWTGEIDSIGVDIIIQFGAFGSLVYG